DAHDLPAAWRGRRGREKATLHPPGGLRVARELVSTTPPAANRIVAFKESDRTYVGELAVENPQVIGADPSSGALYVCAYTGTQTADLIKFSGLVGGKELYRMTLPKTGWSPHAAIHPIILHPSTTPLPIYMPYL